LKKSNNVITALRADRFEVLTMSVFSDWGFSDKSWQGQRGEYWVLAQAVLLIGFACLPSYRPATIRLPFPPVLYGVWVVAGVIGVIATLLVLKGLLDLGRNLTPLPHPKDAGELVQTGVYGMVRHPLYGGITLAVIAWAIYLFSVSHLVGTIVLFVFFNAKASREEVWLTEKYPEYENYRQRVKKLIPWIY
jgi:protein-S-isoprenylcysteine O-methyltransferase Ste14